MYGVGDGFKNVAQNAANLALHPIDSASNIASAVESVAYHLGVVLYEVCDITGTYLKDPVAAQDKIYAHADNIKALYKEMREKLKKCPALKWLEAL